MLSVMNMEEVHIFSSVRGQEADLCCLSVADNHHLDSSRSIQFPSLDSGPCTQPFLGVGRLHTKLNGEFRKSKSWATLDRILTAHCTYILNSVPLHQSSIPIPSPKATTSPTFKASNQSKWASQTSSPMQVSPVCCKYSCHTDLH
jgi:hypothetical protein